MLLLFFSLFFLNIISLWLEFPLRNFKISMNKINPKPWALSKYWNRKMRDAYAHTASHCIVHWIYESTRYLCSFVVLYALEYVNLWLWWRCSRWRLTCKWFKTKQKKYEWRSHKYMDVVLEWMGNVNGMDFTHRNNAQLGLTLSILYILTAKYGHCYPLLFL